MSHGYRVKVLSVIATDRTFEKVEARGSVVWSGKCIHCNAHLLIALSGEPISRATIEHIVPRTHGGTDDVENLAMACARCNHQKGVRLDVRSPRDAKYQDVVTALQQKRRARWREPSE